MDKIDNITPNCIRHYNCLILNAWDNLSGISSNGRPELVDRTSKSSSDKNAKARGPKSGCPAVPPAWNQEIYYVWVSRSRSWWRVVGQNLAKEFHERFWQRRRADVSHQASPSWRWATCPILFSYPMKPNTSSDIKRLYGVSVGFLVEIAPPPLTKHLC